MSKIYNLIKPLLIIILITSVGISKIQADLNGLVNPILVSNTYTFTDGERADGFVGFVNGFDLPIGGTVTLNLAPGCMVRGTLTMNNGTIKAEAPVIFGPGGTEVSGRGYFNIPELVVNSLVIEDSVRLTGTDMTIRGYGSAGLDLISGDLDCGGISNNMTFDNISISGVKNLFTETTGPRHFNLTNASFSVANEVVTIASPFIKVRGECSIGTDKNGKLVCPGAISIDRQSQLMISSLSRIELGGLFLQEPNSLLVLDNASLSFNNTSSVGIPLSFANTSSTTGGSILILGSSILKSPGLHTIIIPPAVALKMGPAARLALSPPIHLTVN